jgi:hydrogenase expression/formation protein HypD
MRFIDEFRAPAEAKGVVRAILDLEGEPVTLMEVCGGQTHTLLQHGIDRMLAPRVTLVHGPGCPVCVTPVALIDQAIALAARPEVVLASFGDMLRVPGTEDDLLSARARGGDVRVVYSPMDALALARAHPERQVVFFAVGFETTAPANAMAVWQAHEGGVANFSILCSHVLVPPAVEAILSSPDNRVNGLIAAGHVCAVMGTWQYEPLAEKYGVPIVVAGFEPNDLLQAIFMAAKARAEGRAGVEIQYSRAVRPEGNVAARELIDRVFETTDREWRGIGTIPASGLAVRAELRAHDAAVRFDLEAPRDRGSGECIAGAVLMGARTPRDCPAFANRCTPDHPLGAPMVSTEGACAAYFAYGRNEP